MELHWAVAQSELCGVAKIFNIINGVILLEIFLNILAGDAVVVVELAKISRKDSSSSIKKKEFF